MPILHQVQQDYAALGADTDLHGMASTLVGVQIVGNEVTIFNVGDSRAYLLTDDANGPSIKLLGMSDGTCRRGRKQRFALIQTLSWRLGKSQIEPIHMAMITTTGSRFGVGSQFGTLACAWVTGHQRIGL